MDDTDDPDYLWCYMYCKQPDNGQKMILFDRCEYWYHCSLENDSLVEDNIDFICYKCSGSTPP